MEASKSSWFAEFVREERVSLLGLFLAFWQGAAKSGEIQCVAAIEFCQFGVFTFCAEKR